VIYYYCDIRDSPRPDINDLLTSLLRQIVRQAATTPVALLDALRDGEFDQQLSKSSQTLILALKQAATEFNDIYCFIDALDEFPHEEAVKLVGLLSSMKQWQISSMHILATSQLHGVTIRSSLERLTDTHTRIDLHGYNCGIQEDIVTYVRHCLGASPLHDRWHETDEEVLMEMEDALVRRSDGS
jgi:hypothetical protein